MATIRVECLESISGYDRYNRYRPVSFAKGDTYDISEELLADLNRGDQPRFRKLGAAIETATSVSTPPKRKRGRPKKVDAHDARLVTDE